MLAYSVTDPGNFLSAGFEQLLCFELSDTLSLPNANAEKPESQQKFIVLKVEALSRHTPNFEVQSVLDREVSNAGDPTHRPFSVTTMDADLETAQSDHLQNKLRRLLGL